MGSTKIKTATEIEVMKTVSHIHEVSILLNSNIQDALECVQESKTATTQLAIELENIFKQAEQKLIEAREELVWNLSKLDNNVSSSAEKTVEGVAAHYLLLEEASNLLQREQRQTQDKLTQLIEQMNKSFEAAASGKLKLHDDMIAQLGTKIDTHSRLFQSTQSKLSDKLLEVSRTVNYIDQNLKKHEEAMVARFEEQNKLHKKLQLKWFIGFIGLIVLIILGYFF